MVENNQSDFFRLQYGNLTDADIEKYSFLIDVDINQFKETLQDLTLNYYKYYILNDADNFNETKKELNKYIDLDIPAINDFITYCLVIASYSILSQLYNLDLEFYAPANPGLNIKGYNERQMDMEHKRYNLSPSDIEILQKNNIHKFDLWVLKDGLKVTEPLKEPIIPEHLQEELFYKNTIHYGDWDLKQEVKHMVGLDLLYTSNDFAKTLSKAVGKSYFDMDKKEVVHND